jgi:acyl carrier protein
MWMDDAVDDVAKGVIEVISTRARGAPHPVQPSDRLDALGIESLDILEITFDLEQRFDIEIPFNANDPLDFQTVGALIAAIERLVAAKAAGK